MRHPHEAAAVCSAVVMLFAACEPETAGREPVPIAPDVVMLPDAVCDGVARVFASDAQIEAIAKDGDALAVATRGGTYVVGERLQKLEDRAAYRVLSSEGRVLTIGDDGVAAFLDGENIAHVAPSDPGNFIMSGAFLDGALVWSEQIGGRPAGNVRVDDGTDIAATRNAQQIVTAFGDVWFTDIERIKAVHGDGGGLRTVFDANVNPHDDTVLRSDVSRAIAGEILFAGDTLVSAPNGGGTLLFRVDRRTGTWGVLARFDGDAIVESTAVAGDVVYYSVRDIAVPAGRIFAVPLAGGVEPTLVDDSVPLPGRLVVDHGRMFVVANTYEADPYVTCLDL